MDISTTDNDPIGLNHFMWLGFRNENGALIKDDFEGEIQYKNNAFWYCKGGVAIKRLDIAKDINDIYLEQYYRRKK